MNKRQKEVIQYQLDSEKKVLEQLTKQYQRALNDIDRKIRILQSDELTQSRIYRIEHQKVLKKQVEAVLEKLHADEYTTIHQFLTDSYTDAFVGTVYDMFGQGVPLILPIDKNAAVKAVTTDSKISEGLYESLGVDTKKLKKTISAEITRGIASDMPHSDIAKNIARYAKVSLGRAKTIVRTESHRIQQTSKLDAQNAAKAKGANVVKQWNSTLDGDTRKSHRRLDGQIRELDEPFEMDGKKAMHPGGFGDPAEDCNCRCQLLQRSRLALDEKELKALRERAVRHSLYVDDPSAFRSEKLPALRNFEEFKKNYLKAAEKEEIVLENTGKSGIIKEKDTSKGIGIQYFAKMSEAKFNAYALNPDKNPNKARAFKEALGYDLTNYLDLMKNIEDHIDESKFVEKDDIGHGVRYEYIMALEGPNGKTANVLTAWIQDGDEKRLTSVYVTDKKVKK